MQLQFEGLVGAEGYRSVQPEKAGWRYGFLASLEDGSRAYGEVYSGASGAGKFSVPENTRHLWLVVMGAPTEHWSARVAGDDAAAQAPPTNNGPIASASKAHRQWRQSSNESMLLAPPVLVLGASPDACATGARR